MSDKPVHHIEVEIPNADQANLNAVLPEAVTFDELVDRRQKAKDAIAVLERTVDDCNSLLGLALDCRELKSVVWRNQYIVTRVESKSGRKTVSRERLLNLGVAPHVIEQATVQGEPSKPTIMITKVSKKKPHVN